MSYNCKECKLKFETEAAKRLHDSVIHKQISKKKVKSPQKKKEPLLSLDGRKGYLSLDGGHVIAFLPDGKSKTIKDYAKKMRKDFPDFKVGDKLFAKEVRDLFKHNIYIQKDIKGAKLEVKEIIKVPNGIRRYKLENRKLLIRWSEGLAFRNSKLSKLKDRHFVLRVTVHKK